MYCVQIRIYCDACNQSYIDKNYHNHLRSQGHINNIRKNQFIFPKNQFNDSKNTFYRKMNEKRT